MDIKDRNRGTVPLTKRSVTIAGHRTSISLEELFWDALQNISAAQKIPLARLITQIDATRQTNLSSAIRVFILSYYMDGYMDGATGK